MKVHFDQDGRLDRIEDASGADADFNYRLAVPEIGPDTYAEVVSDAEGNPTELIRDERGNVIRRMQRVSDNATPTDVSDDLYLVSVFEYDAKDRQTTVYEPFTATGSARYTATPTVKASQTQYDPDTGDVLTVTDALGNKTRFEAYDEFGNPTRIIDPLGNVTQNIFNPDTGLLDRTIDALGNVTDYTYDDSGNLLSLTQYDQPSGGGEGDPITPSTFTYDDDGRLTQTTDFNGISRYFAYDGDGNQTHSWSDKDGQTLVSVTTYDNEGRVLTSAQYTLVGAFATESAMLTALAASGGADWTTATTYTLNGQVATTTDRFGNVSTNVYDARGNLIETRTSSQDENGSVVDVVTRTVYDNNGRAVFTTDPFVDGQTTDIRGTQTVYDDLGRVIETRRIKHLDVQITADPLNAGLQVSSVNNAGTLVVLSTVKTRYDNQGRMHETESPTGVVTRYAYDDAGRQTTVTLDPDDAFGLLATTTYAYDNAGRQTRITDALGRVTEYVYDDLGRVIQTTRHGDLADTTDNLVTTAEYDSLGRQAAQTDALNRRTVYNHDDAGRLTGVTLPDVTDAAGTGSTTGSATYTYGYDDYGNQTTITGPNQQTTTFTYDHLGRQLTRTLPLGQVESMHYDDRSLSEVTNLAASTALGQLAYSVDFEGNVTAHLYDNTSNGGGQLVQTAYYDADDITATITTSMTPAQIAAALAGVTAQRTIAYTYDALGRQVEVNDSAFTATNGRTHAITYDADGRTAQEVTPQGTINYEYNDLGQKTATYTTNTRTEYGYDTLGRMNSVQVTKRGGVTITENQTTHHFDLLGNLDAVEQANGVTVDYVYDAFNRLDDLYHFIDANSNQQYDSSETLIASFDYSVDKAGNRISAVERIDVNGDGDFADPEDVNQTFTWTYDTLNRLVQETYDGVDNTLDYVTRYSFDLASNRLTAVKDTGNADPSAFTADETTTYTYDANDRLTQEIKDVAGTIAGDTNTVYAYDNTTQIGKTVREGTTVDAGSLVEDTTFTYDAMGRMTSTTVNKYAAGVLDSTTTTTYTYNHKGLLVTESVDDGTTITNKAYLFDLRNPTGYAQVLEEYINDVLTRTYTLGHDVIAQHDSTNGNLTFLYDGHGSTRALLTTLAAIADAAGVKQAFTYDAYGNAVGFSVAAALTTLLYSGEWTGANGTQYLRARWYDPSNGRFNRLDPFAGNTSDPISLHKYLYTHGDPIMGIDPSGRGRTLVSILATVGIGTIINSLFLALDIGRLGFATFYGDQEAQAEAMALILIDLAYFFLPGGGGGNAATRVALGTLQVSTGQVVSRILVNPATIGSSVRTGWLGIRGLVELALFASPSGSSSSGKTSGSSGPGEWVKTREHMSGSAQRYQSQISGRPATDSYLLNGVKFDGFDAAANILRDAKDKYAQFVNDGVFAPWWDGAKHLVEQARRQISAAKGTGLKIEWHFSEQTSATAARRLLQEEGLENGITIRHTPNSN